MTAALPSLLKGKGAQRVFGNARVAGVSASLPQVPAKWGLKVTRTESGASHCRTFGASRRERGRRPVAGGAGGPVLQLSLPTRSEAGVFIGKLRATHVLSAAWSRNLSKSGSLRGSPREASEAPGGSFLLQPRRTPWPFLPSRCFPGAHSLEDAGRTALPGTRSRERCPAQRAPAECRWSRIGTGR